MKYFITQLILMATVVMAAHAETVEFSSGAFRYRIVDQEKGLVEMKAVEQPSLVGASLDIPATVTDGVRTYSVSEVAPRCFDGYSQLTAVRFPATITYIGEHAFRGCPITEMYVTSATPPEFIFDDPSYSRSIDEMLMRDPFIFADRNTHHYYTYLPRWVDGKPGIEGYKSRDLRNWKSTDWAWLPSDAFLGNCDNWAPDMYEYGGKHHIFVTFARVKDLSNTDHWNIGNFEIRTGTTIFTSDNGPEGRYHETLPEGELNYTPPDMMAIDGSLYVDDDGQPWMIYSGELTQFYTGRVYAQKMKRDLSAMEGEPVFLFEASDAPWAHDSGIRDGKPVYITDAPFVFKEPVSGNLIMTWSSHSSTRYAVGQAVSPSGNILGPWEHDTEQLNRDDGGHAMIFKDFMGRLMMSYHTTENGRVTERMCIREMKMQNGKLAPVDYNGYRVTGDDVYPSFDEQVMAEATVYIPREYYIDYRLTKTWTEFSNLNPYTDTGTGIDDVVADDAYVLFDVMGRVLSTGEGSVTLAADGQVLVDGVPAADMLRLEPGIYVLKSGRTTMKFTVK